VEKLFSEFQQADDTRHLTIPALEKTGDHCLPVVKNYLWKQHCEGARSRELIMMLGRMPGSGPTQLLEECLLQFPGKTDLILPAMMKANIQSRGNDTLYKKAIKGKLDAAVMILFYQGWLESSGPRSSLVYGALNLELISLRQKCLDLFSFLYDAETIRKAKTGFEIGTKESIANALELVQVSVDKELAGTFTIIFENFLLRDKITELRKLMIVPVLSPEIVAKNILFDIGHYYSAWTKACVLYSMEQMQIPISREFVRPFTLSENRVLKDTAEFIISTAY
jgi:hypothetical protein